MVQPQAVPLTMEIKFEQLGLGAIQVDIRVGFLWRGMLGPRDADRMADRVQEALIELFP